MRRFKDRLNKEYTLTELVRKLMENRQKLIESQKPDPYPLSNEDFRNII